ncbi:VapE domain-containing protein [Runella limosa]|uniref:VapE domain-containing protein n=1 Tax=Runella limosa TaxID=370978 RepID=UPI0004063918|nr:VapE domain-containing protein [Runella limosa]
MSKTKKIEKWISDTFDTRYNKVLYRPELKIKSSKESDWTPLDDRFLSSLIRRIENDIEIRPSKDLLYTILESDFTKEFDPFKTFFEGMKIRPKEEFDEKGLTPTIDEMASTVKVVSPKGKDMQYCFKECLRMWLTASVANALNHDRCHNQTCLVLTGGQGAFKTTWLNNLYPTKYLTKSYLFCDEFNIKDKDTKKRLSTMFMINIDDQLRDLNKHDAEILKTYISLPNVTMRLAYGKYDVEMPRIANFVGSVNGNDFLTDSSGARRFLPFEVSSIDIQKAQNVDVYELWREAYSMYKNGMRYWLSAQETKDWFDGAEAFSVRTPEYEFLTTYFKPVKDQRDANKFLKTAQIMQYLKEKTRMEMNQKKLRDALAKSGFMEVSKRLEGYTTPQYFWAMYERLEADIEVNKDNPEF